MKQPACLLWRLLGGAPFLVRAALVVLALCGKEEFTVEKILACAPSEPLPAAAVLLLFDALYRRRHGKTGPQELPAAR